MRLTEIKSSPTISLAIVRPVRCDTSSRCLLSCGQRRRTEGAPPQTTRKLTWDRVVKFCPVRARDGPGRQPDGRAGGLKAIKGIETSRRSISWSRNLTEMTTSKDLFDNRPLQCAMFSYFDTDRKSFGLMTRGPLMKLPQTSNMLRISNGALSGKEELVAVAKSFQAVLWITFAQWQPLSAPKTLLVLPTPTAATVDAFTNATNIYPSFGVSSFAGPRMLCDAQRSQLECTLTLKASMLAEVALTEAVAEAGNVSFSQSMSDADVEAWMMEGFVDDSSDASSSDVDSSDDFDDDDDDDDIIIVEDSLWTTAAGTNAEEDEWLVLL